MPTISVRISEKEKAALRRHGQISKVLKEAISLYLETRRSRTVIKRLKQLQRRAKVRTAKGLRAALINEDRSR